MGKPFRNIALSGRLPVTILPVATPTKKRAQQCTTGITKDAENYLRLVVQAGIVGHIVKASAGPGFGIGSTKHQPLRARQYNRPGAHGAWLQHYHYGATT